jgi:general secretion pathway protein E
MTNEHAVSYSFVREHGLLPTQRDGDRFEIAARPPINRLALAELRRRLQTPIVVKKVDSETFEQLVEAAYSHGENEAVAVAEGLEDASGMDILQETLASPEDLLESDGDDAPLVRLINALLREAVQSSASDVHFEPFENHLSIRFRIDGTLREVLRPPRNLSSAILSRLKVMSRLDIAEKRLPQDGRITFNIGGRSIDVRVSTLPCGRGERAVLRLLDKQSAHLRLDELGMSEQTLERVNELLLKPHGIILATGPTGAGKTTALYAMLSALDRFSRNILTIEDPIEYLLEGVGQSQVNSKIDMTFAKGLRAILRQDPDVIMVGEIRDEETAQVAVQASLTGHLVFSSLHTNTAIGALTRLRDIGIQPFLLASTVTGVLAQRLIRKLCPHCKTPYTPDAREQRMLKIEQSADHSIYRAIGCEHCAGTGYHGRTGVYELVTIDQTLQGMIHDEVSEQQLEYQARQQGPNIRADALRLLQAGVTTTEEVLRVTVSE